FGPSPANTLAIRFEDVHRRRSAQIQLLEAAAKTIPLRRIDFKLHKPIADDVDPVGERMALLDLFSRPQTPRHLTLHAHRSHSEHLRTRCCYPARIDATLPACGSEIELLVDRDTVLPAERLVVIHEPPHIERLDETALLIVELDGALQPY